MWKILASIAVITASLPATLEVCAQEAATTVRLKVVAFFTVSGERDHFLFAQQAMRAIGANAVTGGYTFAATSDWDALSDTDLRDVGIVIWLNDMPRTPAQRQAFERYMKEGGGWLGFHVSGFGSETWPWFGEFLGGSRFRASNWPSLPARVNVDAANHPTMSGVPPTFVAPLNEWYAWTPSPRVNPAVKVLLTLDASNFPLGVKNTLDGADVPVAWINTNYRMVYLNYGHGDRIYSTPVLPLIVDNSLRWLLHRQP
jgi:type 1 glutamine amidotransferase